MRDSLAIAGLSFIVFLSPIIHSKQEPHELTSFSFQVESNFYGAVVGAGDFAEDFGFLKRGQEFAAQQEIVHSPAAVALPALPHIVPP